MNRVTTAMDFRERVAKDEGRFSPRQRFNWGYHDGVADERAGREPVDADAHPDYFYGVAYGMGRFDARHAEDTSSSEGCWLSCYGPASAARDGQSLDDVPSD